MYCEITDLRKRDIEVKTWECQLANEDDLQSKSTKEIVLRIVFFYIRIDYRHSSVMKSLNSLPPAV